MSEQASSGASPFSPRAVLTLLLFGTLAFIAALYLIGTGEPGDAKADGGAHVAGNGLNGYQAFAELLRKRGYEVSNIRNTSRFEEATLMILTPPVFSETEEINAAITQHRRWGPTIVVLPKWSALPVPNTPDVKSKDGWVRLFRANEADWAEDLGRPDLMKVELHTDGVRQRAWQGLGYSGVLPEPQAVQSLESDDFVPLVTASDGRVLAAFWDDGGYYPELSYAGDIEPYPEDDADPELYPLVIVAEPDLLDNYGMADRTRAMAALALVETTLEGYDMPIAFDLTFNGYSQSENLLTLAFRPPFLAATLCFLLAALVVAWRALKRFGPPLAATPVFAFGKRQLATNGAALIQRSKRFHLLGAPYAAMLRGRVAQALGLRQGSDTALTESEIDRLLERRGIVPADFSVQAEALRQAKGPHELLRRAHALKQIERKLAR